MFVLKSTANKIGEELTEKKLANEQLTQIIEDKQSQIEYFISKIEDLIETLDELSANIQKEIEESNNEQTKASLKRILNSLNANI